MSSQPEDGREKCPYGPTTGYTALIISKALQQLKAISRVLLTVSSDQINVSSSRPADVYSLSV